MSQYVFGTGSLIFTPPGANPTPVQVGVLQEVTIDTDQAIKELRGAYKFPVAIGETTGKITGTAKLGQINGALFAAVLSGATVTSGASVRAAQNEAATIPGSPYQVTVTQSATFLLDQGVYNYTLGRWMTRVASAPTTGQYSVAAGVYTFAAADTTNKVAISYTYSSAIGNTIAYANQLMGTGTEFALRVMNFSQGKHFGTLFKAVRLNKITMPFKNEDFLIQDIGFSAYADSEGNISETYVQE